MILKHFNFDDKEVKEKFQVSLNPTISWEYYYNSYCYALTKIIESGLGFSNGLNPYGRPIMFLVRHNLELCLKNNLEKKGFKVPTSHDFSELTDQLTIPSHFLKIIQMIHFDSDGSAYRYYTNKNGVPFFKQGDTIELGKALEIHNTLVGSVPHDFHVQPISQVFEYTKRINASKLTLYMYECSTLGHIRTQYDYTISLLIDGILQKQFSVKLLFLPLMFLLRHSLELALKFTITETAKISSIASKIDISSKHSLSSLFRIYADFLKQLDISALPENVRHQLERYLTEYPKLNETIHQLDSNSEYFRFPFDKKGAPVQINTNKLKLADVLRLYDLTDPFLTFTNEVLLANGIIKYSQPSSEFL